MHRLFRKIREQYCLYNYLEFNVHALYSSSQLALQPCNALPQVHMHAFECCLGAVSVPVPGAIFTVTNSKDGGTLR